MTSSFIPSRRQLLLSGACIASELATGSTAHASGADLAVIVNPNNKHGLTVADIEAIFRSTRRYWSGRTPIVAFNSPAGSAERYAFDRAVLGLEPEEVSRYWIDRKIRGGEPAPRPVPNPLLVGRLVGQMDAGIGYLPFALVQSGLRVVARVRGRELLLASDSPGRAIFEEV